MLHEVSEDTDNTIVKHRANNFFICCTSYRLTLNYNSVITGFVNIFLASFKKNVLSFELILPHTASVVKCAQTRAHQNICKNNSPLLQFSSRGAIIILKYIFAGEK